MEVLADQRGFPVVGPLVGRFLYQLVKLTNSKHVFEFGSGFGYSAVWMAMALPEDAKLICTDYDPDNVKMGIEFLKQAGLDQKVSFEVGNALETFAKYDGPFDFIFCDFDKTLYSKAFELGMKKLKKGGIFAADNVLWSGWVADRHDHSSETEAIRKFNEKIYNTECFFTTICPLRDGVSISLKI